MAAGIASPVIYLDQAQGRQLLADVQIAGNGAYQPILHHIFSQQTTRAGCGIKSCALVLSANVIGCGLMTSQETSLISLSSHETYSSVSSDSELQKTSVSGLKRERKRCHKQHRIPDEELFAEMSSFSGKLNASSRELRAETADARVQISPDMARASSRPTSLPYTEVGLYDMPQTLAVTSRDQVASGGLTLEQVAAILRSHGCAVTVVHATKDSSDRFRQDVSIALAAPKCRMGIVVNFHRGPLSTGEVSHRSHHSPLVAYHKAADRVLVLDTAAPRERHFWATVDAMVRAMSTVDRVAGMSRGYCLFSKPNNLVQ